MTFLGWIGLAGALLLFMAFATAGLNRLPVTSSGIYLLLGVALGPAWLDLMRIDFVRERVAIEHLTEIAVIISLFVGGLKLRLPLSHPAWSAAFRLAGPVMLGTIAGVALFSHLLLGFDWPTAFLLGAVLAPTDPVLAGMVAVNDAADQDRMRYGLSGEAGFNDGAAFPFVIFSLLWMEHGAVGSWAGDWALHRLLWAVPAGLLAGYGLGKVVGRLAIHLRSRNPDNDTPGDFLALSLIAVAYSAAEAIGAWGFLAVFAAGLGFRRSEVITVEEHPAPKHLAERGVGTRHLMSHPPAEALADRLAGDEESKHPTQAAGHVVAEIITFGDTAERLLEVMMVVVLGICLSNHWDWRALPLALVLFAGIRPLFTLLFLAGTQTRRSQRRLMAWFGIRGIGSLYYLSYALNHGAEARGAALVGVVLSVVALSVLLHGLTSPFLDLYQRRFGRARSERNTR